MKKRFLIFVFALVIAFLWSQTAEIDSLKNKIQSVKLQPEEKAETLLQLARNYWWQNPDSSLLYVEQAESLSKENNLRELLSKTYNYWGISYEFKEEYENAIFYYNKALEYSYKIEDKEQKAYAIYNLGYVRSLMGEDEKAIEKYKEAIEAYRVVQDSISMAQCMQNIAELYENKNDYDKGLEYYKKAKEIFIAKQDSARIASNEIMIGSIYLELSNFEYSLASLLTALDLLKALNNETGLATVYNMLGNLYHEMQNYDKALEYYEFSLEKNIELGNEDGVSVAYNNIGVIYDEQGDYETALEYYTKSYKSDLERGDKSGVATALNNIGVVHRSMGNNSVALEKLHESLKISEEVEDKNSIANTCSNIAEIYISQDKLEKAKTYLERAAKIADEIQINSLLMKVNHVYFKYYSQRGQFEKAMDYQDRYYAIKDSIYTFNNQNILELQTQHAIEQQERELELLRRREELNKLKISTHKRVRRFFIVIIFLVIVVAAILYYQFKLKKRNSDFLDKVINSLPHPFMIINADTREIEIMNRKASDENLNFYDYDSAKKKYIRKKETPFDIDLILNEEQNNVLVSDYKIENKNGTRYYEIHAYAIKNKGENIKKVIEYAFDVTDRKMAEEKIKQSEAKFRSLFEGASDAILILKGNRFIQCNKQAMELYGVREEQDLIGSTPVDFSPEYQIDGCRSADGASKKIKKALQGENTIFEWRHVKKNGEYFDAEISLNLLEIDGEKYVQAIVRDITKRLQTQRALEESKAKNTAILEAIPDMMFVFDKKAVFQEVHNLSESELAKPVDEFLGKVVSEVIPKKTADMYLYYINKAFQSENIQRFEYKLKIDDQFKFYEARLMLMETDKVLCLVRDYTKQKEAEIALKKSEENFRTVVEDQTELICRLDTEGRMIFVNQSLCRYLGSSQDELLGTTFQPYLLEEDLDEISDKIRQLSFGSPIVVHQHRMKIDGEIRWTEWTDRKLYNEKKEFIGFQAVGRDITEQRKAEERLKKTNKELKKLQADLKKKVKEAIKEIREKDHLIIKQSRHAAMGEMIGNIAHQWRQPLAAVAAIVQSFEDAYEDGELDAEYIEEKTDLIMDLLQHMSNTIDDFRNFFKPNKVSEKFNLSDNIEKTVKLIENSFKNNNIKLNKNLAANCEIIGYPNEFSQVILNILNNSKDAFDMNNISDREVAIELKKHNGKNVVTIADNAGGITDEILDKIFDPYFTTKHQSVGTGLGLYMSKMIIEKNMDGYLEVQQLPDGTKFKITI